MRPAQGYDSLTLRCDQAKLLQDVTLLALSCALGDFYDKIHGSFESDNGSDNLGESDGAFGQRSNGFG